MSRRQLGLALIAVSVVFLLASAGPASANYSQVKLDNHGRLDRDKELQIWKVDEFKAPGHLKFQRGENDGETLKWRDKGGTANRHIGNSFAFHELMATPIPNAAWLLTSGVLALIVLKRKRRNNDQ